MRTLLPLLKTKLFLLGFVFACTIVLATTVPEIKNFIAIKVVGEKITEQQNTVAAKTKKQKKFIEAAEPVVDSLIQYLLADDNTSKGKDPLARIKQNLRRRTNA